MSRFLLWLLLLLLLLLMLLMLRLLLPPLLIKARCASHARLHDDLQVVPAGDKKPVTVAPAVLSTRPPRTPNFMPV